MSDTKTTAGRIIMLLLEEHLDDMSDKIVARVQEALSGDDKKGGAAGRKAAAQADAKKGAAGSKPKRGGNTHSREEMKEKLDAVVAIDKEAARSIVKSVGVDRPAKIPQKSFDEVYDACVAWLEENAGDDGDDDGWD